MNYGLPYKGSKNSIAKWVVSNLPHSHTFVDLFAGGCSITHAAMLSGKFERFIANDITEYPQVFRDAIAGKYQNEHRWISRDDFFRLKDSDPYVRLCWSFGNDMKSYLYAPEVERFKKHLHAIFFAKTPGEARMAWNGFIREFKKKPRRNRRTYAKGVKAVRRMRCDTPIQRRWYIKHGINT